MHNFLSHFAICLCRLQTLCLLLFFNGVGWLAYTLVLRNLREGVNFTLLLLQGFGCPQLSFFSVRGCVTVMYARVGKMGSCYEWHSCLLSIWFGENLVLGVVEIWIPVLHSWRTYSGVRKISKLISRGQVLQFLASEDWAIKFPCRLFHVEG